MSIKGLCEFKAKCEWEGGIDGLALDYFGRDISNMDVPIELVEAWAKMYDATKVVESLLPTEEEMMNTLFPKISC